MTELPDEVTQETVGYSRIPHWLFTLVKPMSVVVYGQLAAYAWMRDGARPAVKRIAADLEVSEDTVERALRELREAGAITIEHRWEGSRALPSRYHLYLSGPIPPGRKDAATPGMTCAARGGRRDQGGSRSTSGRRTKEAEHAGLSAPQDRPCTKKSSFTPKEPDDETSDPGDESPVLGGTPGRKTRAERDRIAEENACSGMGLALRLKHGLEAAGVPGETNLGWLAKRLVAENKSDRSWDLLREMVDLFLGARERYTGQMDIEPFRVFLYRKAALAADAEKMIKARPKVFTPEDDAAWFARADANIAARRKKEAEENELLRQH